MARGPTKKVLEHQGSDKLGGLPSGQKESEASSSQSEHPPKMSVAEASSSRASAGEDKHASSKTSSNEHEEGEDPKKIKKRAFGPSMDQLRKTYLNSVKNYDVWVTRLAAREIKNSLKADRMANPDIDSKHIYDYESYPYIREEKKKEDTSSEELPQEKETDPKNVRPELPKGGIREETKKMDGFKDMDELSLLKIERTLLEKRTRNLEIYAFKLENHVSALKKEHEFEIAKVNKELDTVMTDAATLTMRFDDVLGKSKGLSAMFSPFKSRNEPFLFKKETNKARLLGSKTFLSRPSSPLKVKSSQSGMLKGYTLHLVTPFVYRPSASRLRTGAGPLRTAVPATSIKVLSKQCDLYYTNINRSNLKNLRILCDSNESFESSRAEKDLSKRSIDPKSIQVPFYPLPINTDGQNDEDDDDESDQEFTAGDIEEEMDQQEVEFQQNPTCPSKDSTDSVKGESIGKGKKRVMPDDEDENTGDLSSAAKRRRMESPIVSAGRNLVNKIFRRSSEPTTPEDQAQEGVEPSIYVEELLSD